MYWTLELASKLARLSQQGGLLLQRGRILIPKTALQIAVGPK